MTDRPRTRGCLPVLGVAVALLAISAGGWIVAGPLETPPLALAPGATIELAAGWEFVERDAGVLVTKGVGDLYATVIESHADPIELAQGYIADEMGDARVVVSENVTRKDLPAGVQAVRVSYTGTSQDRTTPFEGTVSALRWNEMRGIVFDAWADQGNYKTVAGDVEAMLESLTLS